ncbi:class I SAM-dependent methyltransferase [aff. Roholtiella sp. LEGE 12411]|uniref:class I SAM-dependent methyltransferase n=1 Tax=aff. Roholtiella sp. LEGE 12411 TaxID=1828822 RepID=UPI00187DF615|nr:class I SAM-dependent methyltransferase [aff. Roholtiella sp. LEGE 12411]MBE9034205.1 class I SAM-dependent methyltransferase [aff. Roholtiella sp. LEGE 12411]
MEDLKQTIISYSSRDLEQRKNWYSPAAEAYNKARPRYPEDLIHQVVEIAQLSTDSKILEVGCGPATATVAFAQLGCSMVCLEPNPNFFQLAQQNCQLYPNVEIQNTSFEEWTLEVEKFDIVLAATSFHWISPEVGYPKAANALKENGYLILLWNKELQPCYEVYQSLSEVYQVYAPTLNRYEDQKTQENILRGLGKMVIDSGQFKDLISGQVTSEVSYTVDEYLMLLNTYSPYIKLEPHSKEVLFSELKNRIEDDFEGSLHLSYISAFHIAKK